MRRRLARPRGLLSTCLEVCGLAVASVGIGLIYLPAGVIAAGLAAVVLGYALGGDS